MSVHDFTGQASSLWREGAANETWAIDSFRLDMEIVSDTTKQSYRPTIHVLLDVYTRMWMGFAISETATGVHSLTTLIEGALTEYGPFGSLTLFIGGLGARESAAVSSQCLQVGVMTVNMGAGHKEMEQLYRTFIKPLTRHYAAGREVSPGKGGAGETSVPTKVPTAHNLHFDLGVAQDEYNNTPNSSLPLVRK